MNDDIGLSTRAMTLLGRVLNAIRIHLGWGDLSETRLSPAHGWLLRDPSKRARSARQDVPR